MFFMDIHLVSNIVMERILGENYLLKNINIVFQYLEGFLSTFLTSHFFGTGMQSAELSEKLAALHVLSYNPDRFRHTSDI